MRELLLFQVLDSHFTWVYFSRQVIAYIKNRSIGGLLFSSDLSLTTIIFSGLAFLRFTSALTRRVGKINWGIVSIYISVLLIVLLLSLISFSIIRLGNNPSPIFYALQIFLFVISIIAFVSFSSAGVYLINDSTDLKITQLEDTIMELKRKLSELESFDRRSKKEGGVFISYSHNDKEIVERIVEKFRSDDINYWLDDKDVFVGEVIDKAISKGIQQNWLFLIILSPSSINSQWVEREYDEASHEEIEGNKIILPVICNGLKDEDVPARIHRKLYVDLSRDFETNYLKLKKSILHYLKEFGSTKKTI